MRSGLPQRRAAAIVAFAVRYAGGVHHTTCIFVSHEIVASADVSGFHLDICMAYIVAMKEPVCEMLDLEVHVSCLSYC